jgi:hypothetical protein
MTWQRLASSVREELSPAAPSLRKAAQENRGLAVASAHVVDRHVTDMYLQARI